MWRAVDPEDRRFRPRVVVGCVHVLKYTQPGFLPRHPRLHEHRWGQDGHTVSGVVAPGDRHFHPRFVGNIEVWCDLEDREWDRVLPGCEGALMPPLI